MAPLEFHHQFRNIAKSQLCRRPRRALRAETPTTCVVCTSSLPVFVANFMCLCLLIAGGPSTVGSMAPAFLTCDHCCVPCGSSLRNVSAEILVVPNDVLSGNVRFLSRVLMTTAFSSRVWATSLSPFKCSRVQFSVV